MTVDEIYHHLRGESQVKLAERLGVNRTPLREALRMLQRENLVRAEHNRRVRIAELTSDDLVELYAMRIVQEAVAIRITVPRLIDVEIARLRWLLAEMEQVAAPETFADWELLHREFHRLLVSRAGGRIQRSTDDLGDYCERYRRALLEQRPVVFAIGAREHAAIVDACERRDVEGAMVALAKHLGRTAINLISVTDPAFDPRPVREALRLVMNEVPPVPMSIPTD